MTPTLRRFRASHPVCTHAGRPRRTWLPLGLALVVGLLAPAAFAQSNYANPLYFTTLAGSPGVAAEVDGTGSAARFKSPYGVTVDANGVLFVSDYGGHTIRKVTPAGAVTLFATDPGTTFFTITLMPPLGPLGTAVDSEGNVYVADYSTHRIRKITPAGVISTLAGGTTPGPLGTVPATGSTDGTGAAARFFNPAGIAIDKNGTLYVGDEGNNTIRKVTLAGVVTTLAGGAGFFGSTNGTGTAARFTSPRGVAVDSNLNVYVAEYGGQAVRKITPAGVVTTLAGQPGASGSTDGTGSAARFRTPHGVAVDAAGNVYVADLGNHAIRKITPAGEVTTLAGSPGNPGSVDGSGSNARFASPCGVAVDASGVLYVADTSNHTIRVSVAPPVFTTQPVAQTVPPSTTATFSAVAAASIAAVTYQWQKDGVPLSGATASTLSIPSALAANVGNYTVVATNAAGSVTSTAAPLSLIGAPSFTLQPASQSAAVGATATFTATATGAGPISYQWLKDSVTLAGATNATLTVPNVQAANLGLYTVIASNLGGPTISTPAVLSFTAPPSFALQPAGQSVIPGANVTFTASATGTGLITYQWLKDGLSLAGATSPTLTLNNVQAANLGVYVLIASNAGGPATSNPATLSFPVPPGFTTQPATQSVAPGATVTFTAAASSGLPLTYQWQKDGVPIPGATSATLIVSNVQPSNLGNYTVIATNAIGSTTSNAGVLAFATSTAGRLINLSILTSIAAPGETFTMGYVVGGSGTAGGKSLVIRAAGPTLGAAPFNLPATLTDPKLELFAGPTKTGENDNWGGTAAVATAMASVGAFPYTGPNSLDAAAISTITTADNSVRVSATGNGTGTVIAEIYDATPAALFVDTTPRLLNVSVLKHLGTGLTVGFVIGGTEAKSVLIRAVGPTLGTAPFNVPGVVADPQLTLFSGQTSIGTNDNWGGTAALTAAFGSVGAFVLPAGSRDAALLATLQPGNYTVQVNGVAGTTGVAIVEVYEVP